MLSPRSRILRIALVPLVLILASSGFGQDDQGHAVSSGSYLVRMSSGRQFDSQKLLLLR